MKNTSFSTILEDLKISFRFAYKNAISYLLAIFGVLIVSGILIVVVAIMIFVPTIFIIGIDNLTAFFESFSGIENVGLSNLAVGSIMFALPFIAPFMVSIGALFGMGREVVESEGTSVEGVFTWFNPHPGRNVCSGAPLSTLHRPRRYSKTRLSWNGERDSIAGTARASATMIRLAASLSRFSAIATHA